MDRKPFNIDDDLVLNLDPEELNQIASVMANVILQNNFSTTEQLAIVPVVPYEEAINIVSLDLISSYTAGITDPLGQLRDWFVGVFNTVSSWIVSSISTFINQYVLPTINAIGTSIANLVNQVVIPAVTGVASSISNFISNTVMPALSGFVSSITNFISQTVIPAITGFVSNVVIPAINTVGNFISQTVIPSILNIPNAIMSFISNTVIPALSGFTSSISNFISGTLLPALYNIGNSISNFISQRIVPAITSIPQMTFQAISGALSQAGQMIVSGIIGFMNQYVMPAFNFLTGSVQGFVNTVLGGINTIVNNVTAGFQSVANIFTGFVNALLNLPNWFMEYIVRPIGEALSKLGEWIWNALPDWFKGVLIAIHDFFTKTLPDWFNTFIKGVQEFFADPLGWLNKNVVEPIMNGLKAIGEWIWNAIPDWLKGVLTAIYDFFTKTLPEGWNAFVKGVQDFFADPLGFINKNMIEPIMNGLKAIGEWIWNALPQWFKDVLIAVKDFFEKGVKEFIDGFKEFIDNPAEWLNEHVVKPILSGAGWLLEQLRNIGAMIWDGICGAINWIANAFRNAVNTIVGAISSFIQFIIKGIESIAKGIGDFFKEFLTSANKEVSKITSNLLLPNIEKAMKDFKIGTPEVLSKDYVTNQILNMTLESLAVIFLPFYGQLLPRLIMRIAQSGAKFFEGLEWKWKLSLRPIGIGIVTDFDLGKAIGASLYVFGEEGMEWLRETGRAMALAWAFHLVRPQTRLLTYTLRNFIPVELPPQNDIIEFTRRLLPSKNFEEIVKISQYYLALYGYSDIILDQYFASPDKYSITVKDRFNVERTVPLSLIYELPSASDVATMMVRDIFSDIEEFEKLYQARGMHRDIGALYYMLRFRYPPPEKLWQFTVRGISGLLWARMTNEEKLRIRKEASKIGAYEPIDAFEFNFEYNKLIDAFSEYMKWHDYARFSWLEDFTSDNQIMIDVQADIPTKIDLRWMARFGIFEHMSKMGIGLESEMHEIVTRVLESNAKSQITMDLTLLSRFIQATGMHPDLVPIVTVAETINAISDERTLLRTATLNLFKEGFWDIESIEAILSGAVTTSFIVAVFDTQSMRWERKYINIPLMFLPPERKLTELRAITDRAMDILKEIQRDISIAYQERIIVSYDEYKEVLGKVIEKVNEFFAKDYASITGSELPDSLKLKFVEEYYKPYVEALETFRGVHIIRRIRAWTQRWLGWIMYRVATGVASIKDVEELIKVTSQKALLSDIETNFLMDIMNIMYRIASREYIPTPSQLLTMSEYVSIPESLIEKVFEARFMSREWASIWKQYISVRTIADDVKSLISTYMYVLRYVDIRSKFEGVIKNYATMIGYTDKELEILNIRAHLEELLRESRENIREYIPSPLMLASIVEYLPEAREYYDDVVKAKNIPEKWQSLWAKYIDLKPLVNDVKTYLARAEQLYARFMITEEDFKKVLEQVREYLGYTDKEIEFLMLVTRYERHRTAWTELIGDVDRMVMLAEYSPRAREFALGTLYKMIDALPIEQQTKEVLKEMWEQFIRVKPVIEEVKRYVTDLINAYVDGTISDSLLASELEALKEWGLDDYEIMFYKAMAGMRKARKLKITLG